MTFALESACITLIQGKFRRGGLEPLVDLLDVLSHRNVLGQGAANDMYGSAYCQSDQCVGLDRLGLVTDAITRRFGIPLLHPRSRP